MWIIGLFIGLIVGGIVEGDDGAVFGAVLGAIARGVDALLMADIAHIAGPVATGRHPSPVPHCEFVTTTTHKTLRGPRGGLILCRGNEALQKKFNSLIFPGIQGGPLMHVISAKAVSFKEALSGSYLNMMYTLRG